ncbi:MAG: malate dehydrogenase [Brevinematia bacterium]
MKRLKVSVIGAGNVGSVVANAIALRGYADVCLIDIDGDMAKGKSIDISQECAIVGSDVVVTGGNDYKLTQGSDISVITAGVARKPGMKREDLVETNARIVKEITQKILEYSPNTIIIVVTNPVDTISYLVYKVSNLSSNRIIGMGGVLDTARFKYYIKQKVNCSFSSINAFVLGGHGDEMVPVVSLSTVSGTPLSEILSREDIQEIVSKTKNGGAEIVSLLKTGSAYYAPGMSVVRMIESIAFDKKEILPCSVLCKGEYGINDVFFGVPVKLGMNGVEEIVEIPLSDVEIDLLRNSVESVKNTHKLLEKLKII